jgi:hypothetical protein
MGFSIELSGTTTPLGYHLDEPIELDKDKEWHICLTSFVTYNSIFNVTEDNNELLLLNDYDNNNIPTENFDGHVSIPPGTYEVEDIIDELNDHKKCREAKFVATINPITYKIKLFCKLKSIDLRPQKSVAHLLGFSKKIIDRNTTVHSDTIVNIFPVDAIRIRCNLIDSNYENGKKNGNIIYSFPLDTKPGTKIVQRPTQLHYFPLNTNYIKEVYIQIVDQENRPINFQGERITLGLYIKSD